MKRVFRYLLKTKDLKLVYQRTGQPLKVFCDSDFAGCAIDRKSRSGYVFILAGGAVSWLSKKQPIISQSICEAEFVAMQDAARETVWMSLLLRELGQSSYCPRPCKIFCDNISWSKDEVVAESSKHVQVRYFYVKNCVSKGILDYIYISSSENVADISTKGLNRVKTQYFTKAMGLLETRDQRGVLRDAQLVWPLDTKRLLGLCWYDSSRRSFVLGVDHVLIAKTHWERLDVCSVIWCFVQEKK